MQVVYDSFAGRYSDNPRALYEHRVGTRPDERHLWLCDPRHADGFPAGVATVPHGGAEAVAALEAADLVIANTHIELDWTKKPGAVYLQTWHGSPLKRIHHDVLWAPEGRLDYLDLDVARWDYLLSPEHDQHAPAAGRVRLHRRGVGGGLSPQRRPHAPDAPARRAEIRRSLGIADGVTAVLYTPTWRDDEFYADGSPDVRLALDVDAFVRELGPGFVLLPRRHSMVTHRADPLHHDGVIDVSRHPDVHELHLAADVMITDYSSTCSTSPSPASR